MDPRAAALLDAYDTGGHLAPPSEPGGLGLAEAYGIAAAIWHARLARGEHAVGRKIGFTNRTIWPLYGVAAPMWSWMYDTTVAPLPEDGRVTLPGLAEPRLEPEIAFSFTSSPAPGMAAEEIAGCIGWMAHGVEIVTSPYPGWRFSLADCVAAQALHGCYWYGPPRPLPDPAVLEDFAVTLTGPDTGCTGHAADVLGGPLHAIRFLLDEIDAMPGAPPIRPGEIVTTGTLTDARPVAAGETWTTAFEGIDLPGLTIRFG